MWINRIITSMLTALRNIQQTTHTNLYTSTKLLTIPFRSKTFVYITNPLNPNTPIYCWNTPNNWNLHVRAHKTICVQRAGAGSPFISRPQHFLTHFVNGHNTNYRHIEFTTTLSGFTRANARALRMMPALFEYAASTYFLFRFDFSLFIHASVFA